MQNGMLPVTLPESDCHILASDAEAGLELEIDLEKQQIRRQNGSSIAFLIDSFRRHCLLNGLDDIELTLRKRDAIEAFEQRRNEIWPWLNGFGYKSGKIPVSVTAQKLPKTDW